MHSVDGVIVIGNVGNFTALVIDCEKMKVIVIVLVIGGQVIYNSLLLLYDTILFSLDYSHEPMPLISNTIFNYQINILSIIYQFKCITIYNMMICISSFAAHSVLCIFLRQDVFVLDQHCRGWDDIKTTSQVC